MVLKNKINLIVASLLLVISFLGIAYSNNLVGAETSAKNAVCESLGEADSGTGDCSGGGSAISNILKVVLNILSVVAGVIAVIMIIIAGIKFITSQGDAGSVSSARQTVIYAIVGIVIVLVSQVIVRFVLTEASELNSTEQQQQQQIGTPNRNVR